MNAGTAAWEREADCRVVFRVDELGLRLELQRRQAWGTTIAIASPTVREMLQALSLLPGTAPSSSNCN